MSITLSKVDIDMDRRHARRSIASPERVYAIIRLAVDDDTRTLWRIDRTGNGMRLYIVGPEPNEGTLRQLGSTLTRDYTPLLNAIAVGTEWRFRLAAAPEKAINSGIPGKRGKRVSLLDDASRMEWLQRKLAANGAHLPINRIGQPEAMIRSDGYAAFAHGDGNRVTFATTVYEGILAVDDPERLRAALVKGIGRGKAYGMGLLTLKPVGRNS